jgi:signal transduction histidine kinase
MRLFISIVACVVGASCGFAYQAGEARDRATLLLEAYGSNFLQGAIDRGAVLVLDSLPDTAVAAGKDDPERGVAGFGYREAFKHYRWQAIAAGTVVAMQSLLIVWLFREYRRRRRAELDLRERLVEIAHLNRVAVTGMLAASIAHELNQPLGAIVSSGSAARRWLSRTAPDVKEALSALERVIEEAHRAGKIICATKAATRGERSGQSIIEVADLIREVYALAGEQFLQNGVSAEYQVHDGTLSVFGDRTQLRQALLNLVVNAVDAMKPITGRPRVLRIVAEPDASGRVVISIEDTGTGFHPKDASHLFDAFFTTKKNGMGIGLSICRTIVKAHNGDICAAARQPYGSVFTISIPGVRSVPTLAPQLDLTH